MGLLTGKVAVITGSSRGLGFAIAAAYAEAGAQVVLSGRNTDSVNQAVSQLTQKGYQAVGRRCDVASLADLEALRDLALQQFGHLDIWVNNAGVSAPYGPTMGVSTADFEGVIKTNILGNYYGSRVAMQVFLKQRSGKLINLLGRGDQQPVPWQNAYASSKAWIRSFTLALAKENQNSGVGVYAFNPGMVLTDMLSHVEVVKGYSKAVLPLNTVMHFWGQPAEIPARKALWLASAATDGKTGLAVKTSGFGFLLWGVLHELGRRWLRKPDPIAPITITEKDAD